jgi:sulfoxide reductase heme-binding subunit YedZ
LKDVGFAKLVVFVNALVPLALLGVDAYQHQLGANPVEFSERTTGMLTLVFLLLTLTITPLRKTTGWNWLSHFRRMLGLFAYFYGVLHFLIYLAADQSFNIIHAIGDAYRRPFILAGAMGLIVMTPLAATSTNGIIKRMGAAKWKRLHRLIYEAAIAGVIHYYLMVKADTRQPVAFMIALAALLGYRVLLRYLPILRKKPAAVQV